MKHLFVVLGMSLCVAATAQAGVVVHQVQKAKVLGKDSEGQATLYVQNGMVRTESLDSRGRLERFTLIRDGAIWEFTPSAHTYTKIDRANMDKMMAQVPPQVRAMMGKLSAGVQSSANDLPWRDTGKTDHVGSYTCRVWEGSLVGQKEELCIVPYSSLPGGDELSAAMQQMRRTVTETLSATPFAGSLKELARYTLNGIPVSSRSNWGETRVTSVERKEIPGDTFQVPPGYEQEEMDFPHGSRTEAH
jgi:hypothetical protein